MLSERIAARARDIVILHDRNHMKMLPPSLRQELLEIANDIGGFSGDVADLETKLRVKTWRERGAFWRSVKRLVTGNNGRVL